MDIFRRILQGYFGYRVNFVQNVTDIDHKVLSHKPYPYLLDYNPCSSELHMERISQIEPRDRGYKYIILEKYKYFLKFL